MLASLALGFAATVALVLMLIIGLGTLGHRLRRKAWAAIGESLNLHFVPGRFGVSPVLRGDYMGVTVRVEAVWRGTGGERREFTRLRAFPTPEPPLRSMRSVGLSRRVGELIGITYILVGDASFDERVVLEADESHTVRAWLADPRLRQRIVAIFGAFDDAVLDGDGLQLFRRGFVRRPEQMQRDLDQLVNLTRAISDSLRPPPKTPKPAPRVAPPPPREEVVGEMALTLPGREALARLATLRGAAQERELRRLRGSLLVLEAVEVREVRTTVGFGAHPRYHDGRTVVGRIGPMELELRFPPARNVELAALRSGDTLVAEGRVVDWDPLFRRPVVDVAEVAEA